MSKTTSPALTPEKRSALRAPHFSLAAEEMERIDQPNRGQPKLGAIGILSDVVARELKCGRKAFPQKDPRVLSLLMESVQDSYQVRIRNPLHLFDFLSAKLPIYRDIPRRKKTERQQAAALCRSISMKLTNGHADTWI